MKMLMKERMFTWFDSYNVFDENGDTLYTVKGKLAWGHLLKIYDAYGMEVGEVKEKIISIMPKFEIEAYGKKIGDIRREITLFKPKYDVDYKGWKMDGDIFEWDYKIMDRRRKVAKISKKLWRLTDTYEIEVFDREDALYALLLVLAVDAEKCAHDEKHRAGH